ncbi:hypothetical protein [Nocardiopsis rhodophaea]|uniref:hypothetical protein n=1 Tax=Nocardiopsis rhodophaea TaxID=280238 RepID=UPI0031E399D4
MKNTWIIIAVVAILSLGAGFIGGWFSYQAYLAASLQSVAEDLQDGVPDEDSPLDDDTAPTPDSEGAPQPQGPPEPASASDGVFEYAVTGTDRSGTYKDDDLGEAYRAGGEFVIISISAGHVGNSPASPAAAAGEITAYDADGRSYAPFSDHLPYVDEVNPGNTATYSVVFDVPKGTELVVLQMSGYEAPDVATIGATESGRTSG